MKVTASSYTRIPDALWRQLGKLIPIRGRSPKGGRPPLDPRRVADGIYFVMRTGCPWKSVPVSFVSGSSLHRYFQEWCKRGVFRRLWKQGLIEYDRRRHRLAMAVPGRRDEQGLARRGKKRGQIPPIAANWG